MLFEYMGRGTGILNYLSNLMQPYQINYSTVSPSTQPTASPTIPTPSGQPSSSPSEASALIPPHILNEEIACIALARAFPELQSLGTHLLHLKNSQSI